MKKRIFNIISITFIICIANSSNAQNFIESAQNIIGVSSSSLQWGDYNNDSLLDIFVAGNWYYDTYNNGNQARIYSNNGNGTFTYMLAINNFTKVDDATMAWGDYNNDGYLDVLLSGEIAYNNYITELYTNNGDSTFTKESTSFTGVHLADVCWFDYDCDNDLDLVISGLTGHNSGGILEIYRNNGDTTFTLDLTTGIESGYGGIVIGDFNNDGYIDLLYSGSTVNGAKTVLYRNKGDGKFGKQTNIGIDDFSSTYIEAGDYDKDGDLDILKGGNFTQNYIYKNNGYGLFTEAAGLKGMRYGEVAWGDYDNDGDLDALITGDSQDGEDILIYRNDNNDVFSEQTGMSLLGVRNSCVDFGDFDNDGDLDLLISGYDGSYTRSEIFYNDLYSVTSQPSVPSIPNGLTSSTNEHSVTLQWNKASDNETPDSVLTYNIYLGNTPGIYNILDPLTDENGKRKIVEMGNVNQDTLWNLFNLPNGTYYWSVQSIDNSYLASEFAPEQSFFISSVIPIQPVGLSAEATSHQNINLTWDDISDNETGFIIERSVNDEMDYTVLSILAANQNSYTDSDVSTGNEYYYKVIAFNVTDTSTASNIAFAEPFWFTEYSTFSFTGMSDSFHDWGDYDNDNDLDLITCGRTDTGLATILYRNNGGVFEIIDNTGFVNVTKGSVRWGDCNHDGYLDLAISGYFIDNIDDTTMIYINNTDGTFTPLTNITLPGISTGDVTWADYNNDGRLDLIMTGLNKELGRYSSLYKNIGNELFEKDENTSIPGLNYSYNTWADINKDGYLDLFLTGSSGSSGTWYYTNNGDGTLDLISTSIVSIYNGTADWADYNMDGWSDLLVAGNSRAKLLSNNGDSTFTEIDANKFKVLSQGAGKMGDYDNDGDPDALFVGSGSATIYNNNGDSTFTALKSANLPGFSQCKVTWVDFDNDNDLDIFITGINTEGIRSAKLYINHSQTPNTVPETPDGLNTITDGNTVTISWNKASDAETNADGLYYNMYIGSTTQGNQVLGSGSNNETGYRKQVSMGNMTQQTRWYFNDLGVGKYYYSVQSIDNTYAGSSFSAENIFYVCDSTKILEQPSDVTVCTGDSIKLETDVNGTELEYQWQISINNGNDWENIEEVKYMGVNEQLLLFSSENVMDSNLYRMIMINACDDVDTTNEIRIIVNQVPDVNDYTIKFCVTDSFNLNLTLIEDSVKKDPISDLVWFSDNELTDSIENPAMIQISDSSVFYAKISNSQCSIIASVYANELNNPGINNVSISYCREESKTGDLLSLESSIKQNQDDELTWYSDSLLNNLIDNPSSVILSDMIKYYAKVSRDICYNVETVEIIENELPIIFLGNDTSIMSFEELLLIADPGFVKYEWQDGSSNNTFLVSGSIGPDTSDYSVIVTDINGCNNSDTIEVIIELDISVNGVNNEKINIYPVPVQQNLIIESNKNKIKEILVSNLSGQKILFETNIDKRYYLLDMKNLSSGEYLITIKGDNYMTTKMIIVK